MATALVVSRKQSAIAARIEFEAVARRVGELGGGPRALDRNGASHGDLRGPLHRARDQRRDIRRLVVHHANVAAPRDIEKTDEIEAVDRGVGDAIIEIDVRRPAFDGGQGVGQERNLGIVAGRRNDAVEHLRGPIGEAD